MGFARTTGLAAIFAGGLAPFIAAASPWAIRVGAHNVDPKSGNGTVAGLDVEVDSQAGLTFNLGYAFTPNWVLDVLAGLPFEHNVSVGGSEVATVKQLPPVVSIQYHFLPGMQIDPYLGVGVNYTMFMDESLDGGGDLELEDSFGAAVQAGVDVALGEGWFLGADLRWIDIDADVKIDGTDVGEAEIDPIVYGVNLGYRY